MDFFNKAKSTSHRYPTDFLIGDLLVKAGIITQTQLDEAVKLAGPKHLQLGQMLIMGGSINARDLQAAVDCQSLLRDKTLDYNEALRVLKISCKTGQMVGEIIAHDAQVKDSQTNKLGELLLEAGLINNDQFAKAMQRSLATGLPLGRILVLNNSLADNILTAALDLQVRIRDGMVARDEAIGALRTASGIELSDPPDPAKLAAAQAALNPPRKKGVRIGELLVKAGLLTETDVMNALETGLANDQPIGQVMVSQGFVSEQILDCGLTLQRMVDHNQIAVSRAVETLARIQTTGMSIEEVTAELQKLEADHPEVLGFDRMLVLARVLTEVQIEEAFHQAMESPGIVGKLLQMTKLINEHACQTAVRAYQLYSAGVLNQDDAVVALDYCLQSDRKVSVDQAIVELGWELGELPPEEIDEALASEQSKYIAQAQKDAREIDKLKEQLAAARKELVSAIEESGQLNRVEQDLKRAREENEKLKQDLEQARAAAPAEKSEEAQKELERIKEEMEALRKELLEAKEKDSQAPSREESEAAQKELAGVKEEMAALAKELQEAKERTSQLQASASSSSDDAQKEVARAQLEITALKQQLIEAQEKANRAPSAEQTAEARKELEKANHELQALKEQLEKAIAEGREAADKAAKAERRVKTLEEIIEAADEADEVAAQRSLEKQKHESPLDLAQPQKVGSSASFDGIDLQSTVQSKEVESTIGIKDGAAPPQKMSLGGLLSESQSQPAESQAEKGKALLDRLAPDVVSGDDIAKVPDAEDGKDKEEHRAEPLPAAAVGLSALIRKPVGGKKTGDSIDIPHEDENSDSEAEQKAAAAAEQKPAAAVPAPKPVPAAAQVAAAPPQAPQPPAPPAVPPVQAPTPAPIPVAAQASAASQMVTQPVPTLKITQPQPGQASVGSQPASRSGQPAAVSGGAVQSARPQVAQPVGAAAAKAGPPPQAQPAGNNAKPPAPPPPSPPQAAAAASTQPAAPPQSPGPMPPPPPLPAPSAAAEPPSKDEVNQALGGAYARLAESYYDQGNYAEAQSLYEKILKVRETQPNASEADLIADLANLVRVLCVSGKFANAEEYVRRIISILEKSQPDDQLKLADALNTLAQIYFQQNKFDQCQPVLDQSVKIKQKVLGEEHADLADCYRDYARLMRKVNRADEAEKYYSRAKAILAKAPRQVVV